MYLAKLTSDIIKEVDIRMYHHHLPASHHPIVKPAQTLEMPMSN
jgi:hypothetical protein